MNPASPKRPRRRLATSPPLPPPNEAGARHTVLVVDDEEGPRESLRLIFEDSYDVLLASSGQQALALARQRPVDVALVDIRMSGMSGIDLLARLKELDPGIEVAIITAYAALETAKQAVHFGASDYIAKPFDVAVIRDAVARMICRRELQRRAQGSLQRLQAVELDLAELQRRSELLRTRGQIYGEVLHDINRPLTAIVSHLSTLNRRLDNLESLDEHGLHRLRERLRAVNQQADNIANVVQRYLSSLRSETGGPATADVKQVLEDLRDLLKIYPIARGRGVSFLFPGPHAGARVNATDLLQMLLNLTVNALQASPPESIVEIAACASPDPLNVSAWRDRAGCRLLTAPEFDPAAPHIAVTVRDQGPGLPAEVLRRHFDAVNLKAASQGPGLGLAIIRRLILLSSGALGVQTQAAQGTSITIFLSLAPALSAPVTGAN